MSIYCTIEDPGHVFWSTFETDVDFIESVDPKLPDNRRRLNLDFAGEAHAGAHLS